MRSAFLERFEAIREAGGVERAFGVRWRDLVGNLDTGRPLKSSARELGLGPAEMVAALAFGVLGDGGHDPIPALTRGAAPPGAAAALSEAALAPLFPGASRRQWLALSAGLLQVHDHWEASHQAAQEADGLGETAVSAYWHAIAHRREPDPGNAAYWFRRVGRHPVFAPLAEAAGPLLAGDPALAGRLLPGGAWDPFAFNTFCTGAGGGEAATARAVQRLEMLYLLDASVPEAP